MNDISDHLYRCGVALAIGALVGFEREAHHAADDANAARGRPAPPLEPATPIAAGPEDAHRAQIAAGESSRHAPQDAGAHDYGWPTGVFDRRQLGLLEPEERHPIGVRTFMLIALAGAVAGLVALGSSFWVVVVGALTTGALVTASYMATSRRGDLGLTSEVAAVVVYLLGVLCAAGDTTVAGAAGVGVTGILSMKRALHALAGRLRRQDIDAVLKFVLITVVVLPVLPSEPFALGQHLPGGAAVRDALAAGLPAPTDAPWWTALTISPRKIWLMVVLIPSVSFSGFLLGQLLGTERGLLVTGVVGGLSSSTAVSLSYAQRSRERPELSAQFGIGILLANAIMPLRMLAVVGVLAPAVLRYLALPLLGMVAVAAASAFVLHIRSARTEASGGVKLTNPFEVGPALKFGLVFGAVLLLAQVAQGLFGDAGVYGVAVVTGLTDVDAIVVAVANRAADGSQPLVSAAIAMTLAALSNTVVKAGFVISLGARGLRWITIVSFGLMVVAAAGGLAGLVMLGR